MPGRAPRATDSVGRFSRGGGADGVAVSCACARVVGRAPAPPRAAGRRETPSACSLLVPQLELLVGLVRHLERSSCLRAVNLGSCEGLQAILSRNFR